MKRVSLTALVIALFAYPSICSPSYLIQLTNGNEFVTDQYQEESGQIRFYSHGGAVGIPKDSVRKIRESDIILETQIDSRWALLSPKAPDMSLIQDEPGKEPCAGEKRVNAIPSRKYYKGEKLRLVAELDKALEEFRQASGNRDSEAKKKAMGDMARLSKKISDLINQLKEMNKGVLPDWWMD
ncbi:MAG: hypothetical protein JW883_04830 [Deltaproteobacteria bacterium]|nr:hypothetical protein [Deltaproteobacteria bacterium]